VNETTGNGGERSGHSCVIVGKRQMLSVGGNNDTWGRPDPFPQGLGVFDMTALTWGTNYDANAPAYDAPNVIKQAYASPFEVQWSSSEVRDLFMKVSNTTQPPGGSSSGDKNQASSTPVGAIVGGVVGGIALLAIAGLAVFFYRRQQKKKAGMANQSMQSTHNAPAPYGNHEFGPNGHATHEGWAPLPVDYEASKYKMPPSPQPHELHSQTVPSELSAYTDQPHELDSSTIYSATTYNSPPPLTK
jgi:hypothetical protein